MRPWCNRKILCTSKLHPVKRGDRFVRNSHKTAPGWKQCGKGSTTCCPFMFPQTNQITAQITGYKHQIKDPVNCETANCIYYWKCTKNNCKDYPKCEYIGLTKRPFKTRFGEHKQYVRSSQKSSLHQWLYDFHLRTAPKVICGRMPFSDLLPDSTQSFVQRL